MKMRFRFLALAVCLVLALTACKTNLPVPSAPSTAAPTESQTAAPTEPQTTAPAASQSSDVDVEGVPAFMHLNYDFRDYFTLGTYKGIPYTPADTTVTEEDVQADINTILEHNAKTEKSDKTVVENGDIVHITYKGYLDGVAFEGGDSGEAGYDLHVGSGEFVGNFEEQLIGKQVGTDAVLEGVRFPDNYRNNPDLSGKDTTFEVSIQYILKTVLPELNDEFAKNFGVEGVETVEQFRAYVRKSLEDEKAENARSQDITSVVTAVYNAGTSKGLPEETVKAFTDNLISMYEARAAQYGVDLATLVGVMLQMTEEQFRTAARTSSEASVREEIVISAVAAAEKMDLSDAEYTAALDAFAKENGTTVDKVLASYQEDDLKSYFFLNKMRAFLVDNASPTK